MYEQIERYQVRDIPKVGYEILGEWKDDVHHLQTRLVFNYYTFQIDEAEAWGLGTPFDICHQGLNSITNIIGQQVGPGFHRGLNRKVIGPQGCMHLADMILNSIKAALQAASREIPDWVEKDDYANRWASWDILFKNKCIYWSQSGVYEDSVNQVQRSFMEKKHK